MMKVEDYRMKKGIVSLGVALALVFSLAIATPKANAQLGDALNISWSSSFQVQNLSQTSPASGEIQFYSPDGTQASTLALQTADGNPIPAGESVTYNAILTTEAPGAGFDGSAIIVADTEVAAILNLQGTSSTGTNNFFGSASGISEGAASVGLPLVQRQPGPGFDTWFVVQNAGDATATGVTASFTPANDASDTPIGQSYTTDAVDIEPGAARLFSTDDLASEIVRASDSRFVGSVTVSSGNNEELAVIANQTGTLEGSFQVVNTYGGFSTGSNNIALPLVQHDNAGFFTGVSVQNVSETDNANVTVTFAANRDGLPATPPEAIQQELEPGEALTFNTGQLIGNIGNPAENRYVGAATVESTGGAVVAVVNQNRGVSANEPGGVGTSYEGIPSSTATQNVSTPLLMSDNGGFATAIQCLNTTDTSGTLDVTYSENVVGNGFQPENITGEALPARADGAVTIFQAERNGFGSGFTSGTGSPTRYVGSATITATQPVVCVVNQQSFPATTGDTFLTYNGINF
jgi:hypothetical protein